MQVTSERRRLIEQALLDGFSDSELARLMTLEMDVILDHVAGGSNQTDVVHELVGWAERRGRLAELLAAAHHANPNNAQINAVYGLATIGSSTTESDVELRRIPFHRGRWQWPLLGIIFIVAIVAVGGFVWRSSRPLCDGKPYCLLVARFGPTGHERSASVAERIRLELAEELSANDSDPIDIQDAGVVIADRVEAKALALEQGAPLLIWGWIGEEPDANLRVYFELVDLLGIAESDQIDTFRAEPLLYDDIRGAIVCTNCFRMDSAELDQQFSIVAHAASGFLDYAEHPERAYHSFLEALYCAGQPVAADIVRLLKPRCVPTAEPLTWNPAILTYYAGKSAVQSGDYAAGIALLSRAAEENPDDPAAWIGIAAAYRTWIGRNDVAEVSQALDEAAKRIESLIERELSSDSLALLHHDYGLVHELADRWVEAAREYDEAAQLFGDGVGAYASRVRQGHVLRRASGYAEAEIVLLDAINENPDAPWAYLELAQIAWIGSRDVAAAEKWLDQASAVAPDVAAVELYRAQLCQDWVDDACADTAYRRALTLRPSSGLLYLKAGDFYQPTNPVRSRQSWTEANGHYRLALNYRPHDPWLLERLGLAAFNQGQLDEAADFYEKALESTYSEMAPSRLYCALATVYERARPDDAIAALRDCEYRKALAQQ